MKFKISLIIVIAALVTFGLGVDAFAFHGGGVAQCEGCHTMHNSMNGAVMTRNSNTFLPSPPTLGIGQAGPFLLQASDQSSACLNCHGTTATGPSGYRVLSYGLPAGTPPTMRTPGGDFGWLKQTSTGGHNIVAKDFGYTAETLKAGNVAPGGTYPVGSLHCTSCHDPHGKTRRLADDTYVNGGAVIAESGSYGVDATGTHAVGAYRLLGGKGYLPASVAAMPSLMFNQDPMAAAAPSTYNASEAVTDVIVNYGDSTVGMWCQQCHSKMHMAGTAINVHPNDEAVGTTIAGIYNAYKGTDGAGTIQGYTSLVPVAVDNQKKNSLLNGYFTQNELIAGSDRVQCLSCHRAHASAFDHMTRFPVTEVFTYEDGGGLATYASNTLGTTSAVSYLTPAEMQAALYDRPASAFGVEARALCNKCHAKD